jgi:hypothetical protein
MRVVLNIHPVCTNFCDSCCFFPCSRFSARFHLRDHPRVQGPLVSTRDFTCVALSPVKPMGGAAHGPAWAAAWGAHASSCRRCSAHAGPCADLCEARLTRARCGPSGQRKGAAQPPGRLAWGPHSAAWGAHARHLVLPMQCTAAGCSSCELPSSRSCVTRPLVSPTPWEGGSRGASAATSAAAASSAVEVVPIDGRKQLLPPLGRRVLPSEARSAAG